MNMNPVITTNVAAVGYSYSTRVMRVEYQRGGLYEYYDVDPALFEQMLLPYPWRRVGALVKRYRYRRIAA
jgi:hypothetical protein